MVIEIVVAIVLIIVSVYVILRWLARRRIKRISEGAFGDGLKWQYELMENGDRHAKIAIMALDQSELRDAAIASETRDEFREQVIEWFEEGEEREVIPEDFA